MYGGEPTLLLIFYEIYATCRMFLAVAVFVATTCLLGARGSTIDCMIPQLI